MDGDIDGVTVRELRQFHDHRGWLAEVFRSDDPGGYRPEMAYVSSTEPDVARGPHEHREQTDCFCFLGAFSLYLWDNRAGSPTYRHRMVIADADRRIVFVPPGVVHAYRNTGLRPGLVLNLPDRLYAGTGKSGPVDEVRYEDDPASPFRVE